MDNRCFIVQTDKGLEVFKVGKEEKEMLDRVSVLLNGPMNDSSKKIAGMILDKELSVFGSSSLKSIRLSNSGGYNGVTVYLGIYGSLSDDKG